MSSEAERVALLARLFGAGPTADGGYGIGDDAAVLPTPREPLVWTIDAAVEGVHFRRDLLSFEDLGYRATMAAASDLAAMGARPLGLLAALVLPPDVDDAALLALARGQQCAAERLGVAMLGGNLARGSELSITTTALGAAAEPLRRDGARVGDALWVAGPLGLAAAGLRLAMGHEAPRSDADRLALAAFRRPEAQLALGLAARPFARAAIDVSDGLAQDLAHVARASGVRLVLDPTALVTSALEEVAARLGEAALDLALYGGEDYALVIAAPASAPLEGFTRIGGCEPLRPGDSLLARVDHDGSTHPLAARGFDHFAG
jgi:thiamine-monophosphate kinase